MANEAKLLLSILYAINLNDSSTVSKFESNVLDILSPINVLYEFNVVKLFDIISDKDVNEEHVDSFNSIILLLLLSPYSCITSVDGETIGILYESSQAQMVFQQVKIKELIGD